MGHIGITLLICICAFLIYQKTATLFDDYRYPPPGKMVDVGGYKLHIHSTGEGEATVVLDAGLSGTSIGWTLVQSAVERFTRVCSFDRAGYAWSEEAASKRTSKNLAEELHTLLHQAGIPGPYLLVGHSFGGCNALLFADIYPEETLGVILVDSVHEDMLQKFPTPARNQLSRLIEHPSIQCLLARIGYKRWKGPSSEIEQMFASLPPKMGRMYLAQMNKTNYTKTVSREMESFSESLAQLHQSHIHLQDKPLIVISAGKFSNAQEEKLWSELQHRLLSKSYLAKQIIAKKSDHMINHHQPEIIVEAVQEILMVGRRLSARMQFNPTEKKL